MATAKRYDRHEALLQEHAFALGMNDRYMHFPSWSDDLEHKMMADWAAEIVDDDLSWLDVREAAMAGWEERRSFSLKDDASTARRE